VTLQIERVVDRSVRREKTLRRISGLEPKHLSLALSDRQMRILSAVILAQTTRAVNPFPPEHTKC
jgi:hypothetical protein